MRAPNTFAQQARNNRIWNNSQVRHDWAGGTYRTTTKGRVLMTWSTMSGKWINDTSVSTCKGEIVPHGSAKVLYPFTAR